MWFHGYFVHSSPVLERKQSHSDIYATNLCPHSILAAILGDLLISLGITGFSQVQVRDEMLSPRARYSQEHTNPSLSNFMQIKPNQIY